MARTSPLAPLHQQTQAQTAPYAPDGAEPIDLVEYFGPIELEYAALRKACVLIDLPHRATIELTGPDRLAFLERMLTQKIGDLEPFETRRSFWLGRNGRIEADLRVTELGDRTRLDLDAHAGVRTLETLGSFVIMDDVELTDATDRLHRLVLIGPEAIGLLARVGEPVDGFDLAGIEPGRGGVVRIAGHRVLIDRDDTMGETGLHMLMPVDAVVEVWEAILAAGVRPAGWHALNIARVEAGTPIYALDFGPTSLPHETGILDDRVSFTKGCYLGQEIVARMASRGGVKQRLVALRAHGERLDRLDGSMRQPVTGSPVFAVTDENDPENQSPIGAVTSSVLSPMLGGVAICFAVVKRSSTEPGTELLVEADDALIDARVQPQLRFWPTSVGER